MVGISPYAVRLTKSTQTENSFRIDRVRVLTFHITTILGQTKQILAEVDCWFDIGAETRKSGGNSACDRGMDGFFVFGINLLS